MDHYNAPQWTDFNASDKSGDIDEYFDTEHWEHEPEFSNGTPLEDLFTNSTSSKLTAAISSNGTPRSNGFASPMFDISTRRTNSRINKTGESPSTSMNIMRVKSASRSFAGQSVMPGASGAQHPSVATSLTTSVMEGHENNNTESKENTSQKLPQEASASAEDTAEENIDDNTSKESALCTPVKKTETVEAEKPPKSETEAGDSKVSCDPPISEKRSNAARSKPSSSSNPSKTEIRDKTSSKTKPTMPGVLTSQTRRQSVSKYRRSSNQYVSFAEAVARFQNRTPKRFRSTNQKVGPPPQPKPARTKLTCPMSPALRCKSRVRLAPNQSKESKLIPDKSKSRLSSFPRAGPSGRESSSSNVKTLKVSAALEHKTAMLSPQVVPMLKEIDKMLDEPSCSKDANLMLTSMSKTMRKLTPCKKSVPTIVEDSLHGGMRIKEEKILHFGIPLGKEQKKITRPKPFSFDTRNKESQSKKEKLKNQPEDKSKKSLLNAKPAAPSKLLKRTTSVLKPVENNGNEGSSTSATRTLSFEERNRLVLEKKKLLMKQIVEKEKQARVFHAKPAPTFKPVSVPGNSAESLENRGRQ